jgi:hypothetical protein
VVTNVILKSHLIYNAIAAVIASTTLNENITLLRDVFTVLAVDVGISELLILSQQVCD